MASMAEGIKGSVVFLVCVTRRYMQKVEEDAENNRKFEFDDALNKRTTLNMLPIVMEASMTNTSEWDGSLSMTLGRHRYHKLASDVDIEFDDRVDEIAVAIRRIFEPQKVLSNELQGVARQMSSRSQSPAPSVDTAPASPRSPLPQDQEVL